MDDGEVFISENVVALFRERAELSRPLETGGVLVGVLRDGAPWITAAIEIIDRGRTSASFVIPAGTTPLAVEAARLRDGRVGYLGDWHSHPANVPASGTDRATLRGNARRRGKPREVPALLVVVRDAGTEWEIDVLRDAGGVQMPAEFVLTGPLADEEGQDAG